MLLLFVHNNSPPLFNIAFWIYLRPKPIASVRHPVLYFHIQAVPSAECIDRKRSRSPHLTFARPVFPHGAGFLSPLHHNCCVLRRFVQNVQQFAHLLVADGALRQRHAEAHPVFLARFHQHTLAKWACSTNLLVGSTIRFTSLSVELRQLYVLIHRLSRRILLYFNFLLT